MTTPPFNGSLNSPDTPASRSADFLHGRAGPFGTAAAPVGAGADELEPLLAQVEHHLEALGEALRQREPQAIDLHASQLHRALVQALDCFTRAARQGPIPQPLRARLSRAGAQVAVQRECLARATAALDRAIDAMLPKPVGHGAGLYGATGKTSIDTSSPGVRV